MEPRLEQFVLDAAQNRGQFRHRIVGGDAGHTDESVQFIDRPVTLNPERVFRNALASGEAGLALVAGLGVDAIQRDARRVKFGFGHGKNPASIVIHLAESGITVARLQQAASTLLRIRALRGVRNPWRMKFFDLPGLVQVACVRWANASISVFEKNEAILGGVVRKSFVFMEFEDGGGVAKVAPLAVEAERRKRRDGRAGDWGLGAGGWDWARERTSASRSGMRLRRQDVSANSWTSWVSVGVWVCISSRNWRQWCW